MTRSARIAGSQGPARLTSIDRLEIIELPQRINFATDKGDIDTVLDCFTSTPIVDHPVMRAVGTEQVRRFYEQERRQAGQLRAWAANHVIDGDHDRAVIRFHQSWIQTADPEGFARNPFIAFQAVVLDRVERDGSDRWRIAERVIDQLGTSDLLVADPARRNGMLQTAEARGHAPPIA